MRVRREARAGRVLDALVDRQDATRSPCRPGARVEQPLQVAQHLRVAVRVDEHAVDEVGPRQVQVVCGDGRALVPEQVRGVVAQQLLEPRVVSSAVAMCRLALVGRSPVPVATRESGTLPRRWSTTSPGRATRIGIEEELMIVDARVARPRQRDRAPPRGRPRRRDQARAHGVGARDRDPAVREHGRGGRAAARAARARSSTRPAGTGLTIGSAGTHPFAHVGGPADRRAAPLPRPRSPRCASSRARSSSSACTSTSGVDDPDKAIHVANGMRVHLPVLLALSRELAVLARGRLRA